MQTWKAAMTQVRFTSNFPPLRVVLSSQGEARSQYDLGLMYARGRGPPRDATEAARWFRRSADQGYARAQYMLARMYSVGQGVPQDAAAALAWYRKAADQG